MHKYVRIVLYFSLMRGFFSFWFWFASRSESQVSHPFFAFSPVYSVRAVSVRILLQLVGQGERAFLRRLSQSKSGWIYFGNVAILPDTNATTDRTFSLLFSWMNYDVAPDSKLHRG